MRARSPRGRRLAAESMTDLVPARLRLPRKPEAARNSRGLLVFGPGAEGTCSHKEPNPETDRRWIRPRSSSPSC